MLYLRERRPNATSPLATITQKELHLEKRPKLEQGKLQPLPQEATKREQSKLQQRTRRRAQQALANKFLRLCLASYGGSSVSYFVLSFRAIGLFGLSNEGNEIGTSSPSSSSSSDQTTQFQVQFPSNEDGNCFGLGCGTCGSKLYFLGGQKKEKESSNSSSSSSSDTESDDTALHEDSISSDTEREDTAVFESFDSDTKGKDTPPAAPRYSLSDYSPKVFMLDLANSKTYVAFEGCRMLSGKASPLIMTVNEKLYVLAGTPVSMLPKHPFEVHDPKNNYWEKLPSPPFLKPNSKFFQDPKFRAYVVTDNKIHVSTSSSSFSFNTTTGKWTPCTLFDDHHLKLHRRQWTDIQYPTHFGWMKYPLNKNKDEKHCGLPFDFHGEAIMYDGDVMICLVRSRGVVAYKLVDGKVMDTQVLEGLEIPSDATSSYLANFGEGYLCLLTISNNDESKQDCQISSTPFEVSKVKYELRQKGKMKRFLNCSTRKKLSHYLHSTEQLPPRKIWSPIGCFVV